MPEGSRAGRRGMAVRSIQTAHCFSADHRLAPLDVHGPGHLRAEHASTRPMVPSRRSCYDASLDRKNSGANSTTKLRHSPNTRWPVAAGRIKGVRTRFIDGPPSPEEEPLKSRIRHPGEQPRRLPTPIVLPNTIPITLAKPALVQSAKKNPYFNLRVARD